MIIGHVQTCSMCLIQPIVMGINPSQTFDVRNMTFFSISGVSLQARYFGDVL